MVVILKSKDKLKSKEKDKIKSKKSLYNPNSKKNKVKGILLSFVYLVLSVYLGQREYKDIKFRISSIQKSLPIEEQNRVLPILNLIIYNIFSIRSQNRYLTIDLMFRVMSFFYTANLTYNVIRYSNNENLKLSIENVTIQILFYKILDFFINDIRQNFFI